MQADKKKDAHDIPMLMAPFRARIDALDDQIVTLLVERIGIIREVAQFKKQNNIPAVLPDRVLEVIDRNALHAKKAGIDEHFVRNLYTQIVSHCCDIEDKHLKTKGESV